MNFYLLGFAFLFVFIAGCAFDSDHPSDIVPFWLLSLALAVIATAGAFHEVWFK